MLPVHMVCAGWQLQPFVSPLPPPPSSNGPPLLPYHCHHERHPSRLKEVLKVLCQVLPESGRIRSGNHGMTPVQYITKAMDEGEIKEECLALLEP